MREGKRARKGERERGYIYILFNHWPKKPLKQYEYWSRKTLSICIHIFAFIISLNPNLEFLEKLKWVPNSISLSLTPFLSLYCVYISLICHKLSYGEFLFFFHIRLLFADRSHGHCIVDKAKTRALIKTCLYTIYEIMQIWFLLFILQAPFALLFLFSIPFIFLLITLCSGSRKHKAVSVFLSLLVSLYYCRKYRDAKKGQTNMKL